MQIVRRLSDNRSIVTLVVLVCLSLLSLALGASGHVITSSLRSGLSVAVSPVLFVLHRAQDSAKYSVGLVTAYDASRREATDLRRQLNVVTQQLVRQQELSTENARLRRMLDFAAAKPTLTLLPAAVMEEREGWMVIDKGTVNGVTPFMCAITADGVVGVVADADPFTSRLYTLHRAECRVGAMIGRTRVRGIVHGTGFDLGSPYICAMRYIDLKDDVRVGDDVYTSGVGGVFPSGIPIGRVATVQQEPGSLLKTAQIEPAADPYRLTEVFLVLQAQSPVEELAEQQPTLLAPAPDAQTASARSAAPAMPDARSMQERLAP